MRRALETGGLPLALALTLWPWIDLVEVAKPGVRTVLRGMAQITAADLRRMVVASAPRETVLEDARNAPDALARAASGPGFLESGARTDALLALGDLIAWLRGARPSAWARAAGIGW